MDPPSRPRFGTYMLGGWLAGWVGASGDIRDLISFKFGDGHQPSQSFSLRGCRGPAFAALSFVLKVAIEHPSQQAIQPSSHPASPACQATQTGKQTGSHPPPTSQHASQTATPTQTPLPSHHSQPPQGQPPQDLAVLAGLILVPSTVPAHASRLGKAFYWSRRDGTAL